MLGGRHVLVANYQARKLGHATVGRNTLGYLRRGQRWSFVRWRVVSSIPANLRGIAEDPMWADHVEVSKVLVLNLATVIERLETRLAAALDALEDNDEAGAMMILRHADTSGDAP
jgi:hypothetical protein